MPESIPLVIVLPDGTRQPIAVAGHAPVGRAAASMAKTFGLAGTGSGGWELILERTGLALPADQKLEDASLEPDETLLLSTAGAISAAATALPAAVGTPLAPPPGSPKAAAAGFAPPHPPTQQWQSQPQPPSPAWPAPGQPQPAPAAAAKPKGRGPMIAGAIVSLLLVAGIAVGATLLLTGEDEPIAAPPSAVGNSGGTDDGGDDSGSSSASNTGSGGGESGGSAASGSGGGTPVANPLESPLEPAIGISAYNVELPSGWDVRMTEQSQESAAPTTRTRTHAVAPSGGYAVTIDALTSFDTPAKDNRRNLHQSYRGDSGSPQPGYSYTAFETVPLTLSTAYEWRYEIYDEDRGQQVRRVNEMFDLDGLSFAVRVQGSLDKDYGALATLARDIAATVTTN